MKQPLWAGQSKSYKRPFDLTVLILAHVLLFPVWTLLWLLIPILIWFEDRGPIFYVQRRIGWKGQHFWLLKFRSMRVQKNGEAWEEATLRNDSRVTRIGSLLRATALDELPQVINLWKGDMSLVGPRALPPSMHDAGVREDSQFALRLQVLPGLTGVAQLYSSRHCSAGERLKNDLFYISKASVSFDLKLIVLSIVLTALGRWGKGRRI